MTTKTKHKFHEVLKWIADGETVEYHTTKGWEVQYAKDVAYCVMNHPELYSPSDFRLKPENKPDTVEYTQSTTWQQDGIWHTRYSATHKVTRCGETGKIKSVELFKD